MSRLTFDPVGGKGDRQTGEMNQEFKRQGEERTENRVKRCDGHIIVLIV